MKMIDWQHIVLLALALAGGIACAVKPASAQYIGPVLAVIVPLALQKAPVGGSDAAQ